MTGQVVDAIARNDAEIQLLQVMDESGRVWQFLTEGPIGIDAAHLLVHKDTNEGVEVVYTTKAGRLFALEVNDLPAVLSTIIPTLSLGTGLNQKPTTIT